MVGVGDSSGRCSCMEDVDGRLVMLADAVVLAGDAIDARVAEDAVVDTGDCSGRGCTRDESGKTECAEVVVCSGPWFRCFCVSLMQR